ncbi:MAG TPA: DNA replication/repair protein RecF [Ktedonobacterales bacterium]|nr:DNA replication/repair protein RecF [Ktedonobacterales bacterium]
MRVERLRLTDFRNYRELDLTLPGGLVIFSGRNAQGKSNLLEAVSLIATTRSFRTTTDREAVRWDAAGRFARIVGDVVRRQDQLEIEIILAETAEESASAGADERAPMPAFRKRVRVNGAPRRAMDLVGLAPVVVFAPTDLDLVIGGPSDRRRLLDLTLCQTNRQYCRTLSQYQKVIAQRGALLRRIRDRLESPQSLDFWDDQLTRLALPIMRERAAFLARATVVAARVYARLARGDGELDMMGDAEEALTGEERAPELRLIYRPSYQGALTGDEEADARAMRAALEGVRRREVAQGANVLGPHRDDVAFFDGEIDLATYGSRGQQRSVALAVKLAELEYIEAATGEQPILLLDDVLSELDAQRREDLLLAVRDLDQTLVTTADLSVAPDSALERATVFTVRGGRVIRQT